MNEFWQMSAWEFIKEGGPMMAPILLCSLMAFSIIIEKFMYFVSLRTNLLQLKRQIFQQLKDNNIKEALNTCEGNPSPLAQILKAGISKFGSSREEIKEQMENASLFEIPKLENRLNALATIAHIAPLLGFLGTVTGMISIFHTIQARSASMNPVTAGDLAGGISEALITTTAGLMVAIPAYVAHNYFVSRVNTIVLEMEHGAAELLHLASYQSTQSTETDSQ